MGDVEDAEKDVFEIYSLEWINSMVREIYKHRL